MIGPTPNIPVPVLSSSSSGVKTASPDIFATTVVEDFGIMQDILFESLSGQELLSLSRHDTVNGQNVVYRPIKNLSSLAIQYSPQNLLALQNPSTAYFNNFPIKLETKVPEGDIQNIVYIEQSSGDLIINVVGMDSDEQVEVQILTSGSVLDDTIY